MDGLTNEELLEQWNIIGDMVQRDTILLELQKRGLFPSEETDKWEDDTGAYPITEDPNFLTKLLLKREIAESVQKSWKSVSDPCDKDRPFEVTPVQRFVTNLMSPKTPYMSALLYHGVGVGKTCAAVQIAESWLEAFPRQKVYIVAPPIIQKGYMRTLFDRTALTVETEESKKPNSINGCIGNTYLELSGMLYERNIDKIDRLVTRTINSRYSIFGYISFANHIRDLITRRIPVGITDPIRIEQLHYDIIRKEFSGKLLIIDEAHNLRDATADEASPDTTDETSGGKQLTPFLRKVIAGAEGLKLVLMSATPMYNSYKEIIFILNLLLLNDKKAPISETDIFEANGTIRQSGTDRLKYIANRYVSFMRGENPFSFPIRLHPMNDEQRQRQMVALSEHYPIKTPRNGIVPDAEKIFVRHLPIVPIELSNETLRASQLFMNNLIVGEGGISSIQLEKIIQAGNFIAPSSPSEVVEPGSELESYRRRTEVTGLLELFHRNVTGGEVQYRPKDGIDIQWLRVDRLHIYSPKYAHFINRVISSEGIVFGYTRFVNMGAIPIALALEANGYTPYGRKSKLLIGGIQTPGGRQCALCSKREHQHVGDEQGGHRFSPAYYALITGDDKISPDNESIIRVARSTDNIDGRLIKIVLGSQIASEGIDLRFIREIHVIDSWFHLNKTEQILGRGIRFCSHYALPPEKRNVTVYLYVATLPLPESRESADLYSYRVAFRKSVHMGAVSRTLKIGATDCNLNRQAIIIAGQPPVSQTDSQGIVRQDVSINDSPYTAICDWIEGCSYVCEPVINVSITDTDDSTYDEFSARWRIASLKERFRNLFAHQPFYRDDDLHTKFDDIPRAIKITLFNNVVDNKTFVVKYAEKDGFIHYCNTYYVFQPFVYSDLAIPLATRMAMFPVKRDSFVPIKIEHAEPLKEESSQTSSSSAIIGSWNAIILWCDNTSTSTVFSDPPFLQQFSEAPEKYTKETISKFKHSSDALRWFHSVFVKLPSDNKSAVDFRNILLEYFWDRWFSFDEQKRLIYSPESSGKTDVVLGEGMYKFGDSVINRLINPDDGKLHFLCADGSSCPKSVIDEIGKNTSQDILKGLDVNDETTGIIYGFIVPKKGRTFVFKTAEPPEKGKKVLRGSECANVSSIDMHIKKLVKIGDYQRAIEKSDLDLTDAILQSSRGLANSSRICTLMEIVLRYLDITRSGGRRWFYRPVSAYYTGHRGTITTTNV